MTPPDSPRWRRGYALPPGPTPRPDAAAVADALDALCATLAAGIVTAQTPPPDERRARPASIPTGGDPILARLNYPPSGFGD